MTAPTPDELTAIEARHIPRSTSNRDAVIVCHRDSRPWPCDTLVVLAALRTEQEARVRAEAALRKISDPELVDAPGGFYCPWCGTNVNVHGTTCPVFIARAALAPDASEGGERE